MLDSSPLSGARVLVVGSSCEVQVDVVVLVVDSDGDVSEVVPDGEVSGGPAISEVTGVCVVVRVDPVVLVDGVDVVDE